MAHHHLEQLFRSCDRSGKGQIGLVEFRDLCAEFDISPSDSDAIFHDLDHDGNGQVTFDDFAWGFRDFLSASARRMSQVLPRVSYEPGIEPATVAWSQLVGGLGDGAGNSLVFSKSGRQLAEVYQEIVGSDSSPQLVARFEGAIQSLVKDVRELHDGHQKMKTMLTKEKESHLAHLQALAEELDVQVAQVEAQTRAKAQQYYEVEKESLMGRMQTEMAEMKAQINLFQKLNKLRSRKVPSFHDGTSLHQDILVENRELRNALADSETKMMLLQAEMDQLREVYDERCSQLGSQQEAVELYLHRNDRVEQQLNLLRAANMRLQDTNDSLQYGGDHKEVRGIQWFHSGSERSYGRESLDTHEVDSGRSTISNADVDVISITSIQEELLQVASWDDPNASTLQHEESLDSGVQDTTVLRDRSYKVVFAGDAAVGKSSFINRLCKDVFVYNLGSTLGVDFQVKTLEVDGRNVVLQLWDTAGQERFRAMTKTYFRRADGVVLLYDVGNERSFQNVQQWMQNIYDVTDQHMPLILCANKVDCRDDPLAGSKPGFVTASQGQRLASENEAIFIETSAKSGTNILHAVIALTREMLAVEDASVQPSDVVLNEDNLHAAKVNSSCC